jgi:hypothetical protein
MADVDFTPEDKELLQAGIWEKCGKVAVSPEGQFHYPTGRAGFR